MTALRRDGEGQPEVRPDGTGVSKGKSGQSGEAEHFGEAGLWQWQWQCLWLRRAVPRRRLPEGEGHANRGLSEASAQCLHIVRTCMEQVRWA